MRIGSLRRTVGFPCAGGESVGSESDGGSEGGSEGGLMVAFQCRSGNRRLAVAHTPVLCVGCRVLRRSPTTKGGSGMADVDGTCEARFDGVRKALAASLDSGADVGASVAVYLHGEPVVDIWGGYVDEAKSAPWERDTLTNVWSTTKTMTFVCALMLADRKQLDFHAPVATYWPEFAQGGKEAVEVRHLMGHTAGLSGWEQPITAEQLADWELCITALAAQEPWWEPGTASGYHALTQGYLIGEVVRRITGDSIGTWFASEVAKPLGADFFIGLPEDQDGRVSNVIPPPPIDVEGMEVTEITMKTFMNPPLDATMAHQAWWRRAEIPAANGQGNARSVAAVQSVIAGKGQSAGVRLLSECRHRADLRRAGQRHRPGDRAAHPLRHGLRLEQRGRCPSGRGRVTGAATEDP